MELLRRVVVPLRLALIYRAGTTLAYNPAINVWERLDDTGAEVLRWLRARRDRAALEAYLAKRFGYTPLVAKARLDALIKWFILRRLLYLDHEPLTQPQVLPLNPLATVYWVCTQACNLRCTYCYQEATLARPNELSTKEAKHLIDQVADAGVRTFVFTGGEPFMRRDLCEVARYSKSRGLETTVITNGYLIRSANIDEVAEIFDIVTVSLDHMIPQYHDHHRGTGSWQRALNAIDLLLAAGVRVNVNSTISRSGLQDIRELLRLRQTRQIELHRITPQCPMGRGVCYRNDELTPTELLQLTDQMGGANRNVAESKEARIKVEGAYGLKGSSRMHCGAGLSEIAIDPEGWIYPCKLLQYPSFRTTNIREARLGDTFANNTMLQSIRDRVVDTLYPCKACIIKNHCGGGCRGMHYAFTQEYVNAHPLFCAYLRRSFETEAWASTGQIPSNRKAVFITRERVAHYENKTQS